MKATAASIAFRQAFVDAVDFKACWRTMDGSHSFNAESIRGFIRSIELRNDEADVHFLRARELASSEDLRKDVAQESYARLLMGHSGNEYIKLARNLGSTDTLKEILSNFYSAPATSAFWDIQKLRLNAIFYLYEGDYDDSLWFYRTALEEIERSSPEPADPALYLGAAICERELGRDPKSVEKYLERFHARLSRTYSNFARVSHLSGLIATLNYWGAESDAAAARTELLDLSCTDAAKHCFLRIAELWTRASRRVGRTQVVY